MRLVRLIGSFAIVIFASLACASGAAPAAVTGAPADTNSQLVGVTLGEFSVKADSTEVSAGKVTFAVRNDGAAKHELVVLESNDANLAIDSATGKATEDTSGVKHIGEIDGLDAGKTKALTLDLPAGTYLLICNIPGHYHLGMVAKLVVH
jgi:uncharacterized cupredoxin-like copper-binding protein